MIKELKHWLVTDAAARAAHMRTKMSLLDRSDEDIEGPLGRFCWVSLNVAQSLRLDNS